MQATATAASATGVAARPAGEPQGRASWFRDAALRAAQPDGLGPILLARSASAAWLTALAAACAAAVVVFLCSASYTRKATVSGMLVPQHGVIRLVSSLAGTVVERRADEGQPVRKGDVLFVVASERGTTGRASTQAALASLLQERRASLEREAGEQWRQARTRAAAARRRADRLAADIAVIDSQAALQARRVALAQAALHRETELLASRFVSQAHVHQRQSELLDQEQRLADLLRARRAAERERAAVAAERLDAASQAERERLRIERERASLEQEAIDHEARHEAIVRAPQDGTVAAVHADVGQAVAAAQALGLLLPADSALEAELYAPAHAVGFLEPGMAVVMRYRAYAYQKFGPASGRIREVSGSALRAEDLPMPHVAGAAGARDEPLYRVRVQLDKQAVTTYGREQRLRSGASVDASVPLESRRLVEWVLEPLYTMTGRL